jgi:hypothetical protein
VRHRGPALAVREHVGTLSSSPARGPKEEDSHDRSSGSPLTLGRRMACALRTGSSSGRSQSFGTHTPVTCGIPFGCRAVATANACSHAGWSKKSDLRRHPSHQQNFSSNIHDEAMRPPTAAVTLILWQKKGPRHQKAGPAQICRGPTMISLLR